MVQMLAKTGAMVTTSGVGGGASMTATWMIEAFYRFVQTVHLEQ